MLEGKVALITGASRGIGRATALILAEKGADVVIGFKDNRENAEKLQSEIAGKGGSADIVNVDVSESEDVKNMFQMIKEKHKKLDILVNNAGILQRNMLLVTKEKDFEHIIDVNLKGTFLCMQYAAKMMMRQQAGKIINISSIVGRYGSPGYIAYSASKAGLIGMTLSAAKELGPYGIKVNAVAPGIIETDMIKDLKSDIKKRIIETISHKKGIGQPEDVANVILFLASDLSEYVNGQVFGVDGGQVM